MRTIASIGLLFASIAAHAAIVYTVDNTADQPDADLVDGVCQTAAGTCTLRAAVMQANRIGGAGATIVLPPGTFGLTRPASSSNGDDSGDLNLTPPILGTPVIVIAGAGMSQTTIDANQIDRVLHVEALRTATIRDLTIRGGFGPFSLNGGGIFNAGNLTLTRVAVIDNHASGGGGIFSNGASENLNIQNSLIRNNIAESYGGGIACSGPMTMIASTVANNIAGSIGGGLRSADTLTIRDSTIRDNQAADGGGLNVQSERSTLVNTTISGNFAFGNGGGVNVQSAGSLFMWNNSIVNNDADHDQDPQGGIGGGIYVAGAVFVANTLIAANTLGNVPIYDDCNGVMDAYGVNLLSDVTCCASSNAAYGLIAIGSLGPLQDNGGPTWTHALLPGSAAIDATASALGCVTETGSPLTTDQRGAPRTAGIRCDVGAFEYGARVDRIFRNGFDATNEAGARPQP